MPHTILVAEDEFFVRIVIAEFLREEGYEVIEAANADEALTIFRSGARIDLLFSDVRMPGSMDGCDLASRVRTEWPDTRIILTSGYSNELLTARSRSEDRVVPKPYRSQAVLAVIKSAIGPAAPQS